jgi:hypothetical protein
VTGNGAYEGEMNEVAMFESALRVAVPTQPDPRLGRDLVPRLAQAARASMVAAETRPARRRPRSRLALVARVGIAVALIPLVLAGLAFAGVTVPGPARSAFDSVGITLPNQPSDDQASSKAGSSEQSTTTGKDVSSAAHNPSHRQKGGNSAAAHRHALKQRLKARGKALGHSRGRAVGLTGSTPPGHSGTTGPPDHANAGGSSGSAGSSTTNPTPPTHTAPGPPSGDIPGGNAGGHSK